MTTKDRREREKMENRRIILESAKKVFAKKGFHSATMEEISELAEFSKGAIYNYFKNKETLFFELIDEKINEILNIVRENVSQIEDPKEKINRVIDTMLNFFEDEKETFRILDTETAILDARDKSKYVKKIRKKYFEYNDFICNIMKEGISIGLLKDIDPQLLTLQLTGLINQIVASRITMKIDYDIKKLAEFVKLIYFEGAKK